jgi:hypothetical protein
MAERLAEESNRIYDMHKEIFDREYANWKEARKTWEYECFLKVLRDPDGVQWPNGGKQRKALPISFKEEDVMLEDPLVDLDNEDDDDDDDDDGGKGKGNSKGQKDASVKSLRRGLWKVFPERSAAGSGRSGNGGFGGYFLWDFLFFFLLERSTAAWSLV